MDDPKELLEEAETLAGEADTAQTEAEELRTKADAEGAAEEDKNAAEEAETRAEEARTGAEEAKKEADAAVKKWEKEEGKRFNPLQAALEEERSKRKSERERADAAEEEVAQLKSAPVGRAYPREETITLDELTSQGVAAEVRKIAREEARQETFSGIAPLYDTSVQNRKEFWQREKPDIWKIISEDVDTEIQKVKRAGHLPVASDVDYAVKDAIADLALAGKLPSGKRPKPRRHGSSHEILGEEFSHPASSSTTGRRTKKSFSSEEEAERARMGLNEKGFLRVKAKREALAKEKATKK